MRNSPQIRRMAPTQSRKCASTSWPVRAPLAPSLVVTEDWQKGMRKIKCACLLPRGDGIYTVDPRWKGDSDKAADKATIALIFEVQGEGLRQVAKGYEGEQAWKLTLVSRQ